MKNIFSLLLFSIDSHLILQAVEGGVEAIIVDWENLGKSARQAGLDTEINSHMLSDLKTVRASTKKLVICRVNNHPSATAKEIEQAIDCGVDEIFLPMVRSIKEVEKVLEQVKDRAKVGILIETIDAIKIAKHLAQLPLSRVYIGLNDLAIDRKAQNIFTPLLDGTIEEIRHFFNMPFGFGGLTLPKLGSPIPCYLLMCEMLRLNCSFSFLRRSFHRDILQHNTVEGVQEILFALKDLKLRSKEQIIKDRKELEKVIYTLQTNELTRK
ncbi:MAG: hypothetical protein HY819_21440 [Acidobacteria bacterium]|nr:hypothetical protein [Acidobacteriota bacterium]